MILPETGLRSGRKENEKQYEHAEERTLGRGRSGVFFSEGKPQGGTTPGQKETFLWNSDALRGMMKKR